MSEIARLAANADTIISFLKNFSSPTPKDVEFLWRNADGTSEKVSFANIKKFQQSVNVYHDDEGKIVDSDGEPIAIDAATLGGKSASELIGRSEIRFKMLLDTDSHNGFPERWMWGVTENNELLHWGRRNNYVGAHHNQHDDSHGFRLIPQPPEKAGVAIKKILASTWTGYVLYEDGDLYGIGYGSHAQLGQGNTSTYDHLRKIMGNCETISLSASGYHQDHNTVLALDKDGRLWSWGRNSYGQCGNGARNDYVMSPGLRPVAGLNEGEKFVKVFVSDTHVTSTYALTNQGRVFSCGWNGDGGALGLGDTSDRSSFQLVSGEIADKNIVDLSVNGGNRSGNSAHYRHSVIALTDDGELFFWGYGGNGENGMGNNNNYPSPRKIPLAPESGKIVKVIGSKGSWTSYFALTDTGLLYGWGYNHYGCLGRRTGSTTLNSPAKITFTDANGNADNSGVKSAHFLCSGTYSYHHTSLVITNAGKIYTAGLNNQGQCGLNHESNRNRFYELRLREYGKRIKQISGGGHSDGTFWNMLLDDGRVLGWGDNDYQQCHIYQSMGECWLPQFINQ